jgi:hypothetical protein
MQMQHAGSVVGAADAVRGLVAALARAVFGSLHAAPVFFFRKIFSNMPLTEKFQEMDPGLGAINAGAKITQLGAVNVGAKPPCHLADDAGTNVAAPWRRHHWRQAWRHRHWRQA